MDEACIVFSRKGLFKEAIRARDIKSREHYRNLWPLVTPAEPRKLLTYVSPTFDGGKPTRRSHFRLYPKGGGRLCLKRVFDTEEESRQRQISESEEHKRAKALIAAELQRRLDAGLALPWYFKDDSISEYHFSGVSADLGRHQQYDAYRADAGVGITSAVGDDTQQCCRHQKELRLLEPCPLSPLRPAAGQA